MIIFAKIVLVIALICLVIIIYILWRIHRLYDYRVDLIDRDNDAYRNLPSYERMLYSFKPLTDKYWITNSKKE